MYKGYHKLIAYCASAAMFFGSVGGNLVMTKAADQANDPAVAGIAVSLNNYYSNNYSSDAGILKYLEPIATEAAKAEETSAAAVNIKTNEGKAQGAGSTSGEALESGIVSTLNRLNMRKSPSTTAAIVGYLYSNSLVDIYDTVINGEEVWYFVKSNGVEGYISADFVLTGEKARIAEANIQNKYATVLVEELNVYDSAASAGKVIGTVYLNDVFPVIDMQGDFVRVRIREDLWGYLDRSSVKITTQFAAAVAVDDEYLKGVLDSYITEIDDAKRIYDERMALYDYQGAKSAIDYVVELWGYYISTAVDAELTELIADAKAQQEDAKEISEKVAAILEELQREADENIGATQPSENMPVTPVVTPVTEEQPSETTPSESTAPSESTTPPESTTPAEPTTPSEEVTKEPEVIPEPVGPAVAKIEARYRGGEKYAGEVIYKDELYIHVWYEDGTEGDITDTNAWYSPDTGMILAEGTRVVTMYYGDFRSSFNLTVQPAKETEPAPTVTEPVTTEPVVTEPVATEPAPTQPTAAVPVSIEARYLGGTKYAGDVIYSSELYVHVVYSDGSENDIYDSAAWSCGNVGMTLPEGEYVVTMSYAGLSSSFTIYVQPAQTQAPVVTEPAPTQPPTTEPVATEPAPTEPVAVVPVAIEARYLGSTKYAGDVIYSNELYVHVVYSDGSENDVYDSAAWSCGNVGVALPEGEYVVTMGYAGLSSSFTIYVQPVPTQAPVVTEPAPTEPVATEPVATEPVVTEPAPTEPVISSLREQVVANAAYWVGKCNYIYGHNNLTIGGAVDCSAFTMNIFAMVGVGLPRTSSAQLGAGAHVSYDQLRPGDIVHYPGHVAIYIGNDTIIHAKNPESGICYDSLWFKQPDAFISVLP